MTGILAEAYLHRLDPFAVEFPAGWPLGGLRWYGLAYLAGFVVAWLSIRWLTATRRSVIPVAAVADVIVYVVVGVLIGGRLGYCVFYQPSLFVKFTSALPFWAVLAIHDGGMSSHGGMFGVIASCWLFAVRYRISKLHLLDLMCLVSLPGLFFGRLANFVNAELRGTPLPLAMQSDPPWWSVKYPDEIKGLPLQELPKLGDAVTASGGSAFDFQQALGRLPDPEAHDLVNSTITRLVSEAQAGNEGVIKVMRPLLEAHYPSQIFQALTDGPILMGALVLVWLRPRKPGVIGAWFLMIYGVLRIASEFYRQPDQKVAALMTPLGVLSRGQDLSVLMIIAGMIGLFIVARRDVEPLGGLLPTARRGSRAPA